jgi:hypothetical protein
MDDECVVSDSIISKKLDDVFRDRRSTLLVLPSIDRQVLALVGKARQCWIAGGAALGLYTGDTHKIKDWDLFGTESGLAMMQHDLDVAGFVHVGESTFSTTFSKAGVVVQLVHFFHPHSVADIFGTFDFTTCCFAVEGDTLYFTTAAQRDVESKQINLVHVQDLSATIRRIARYGSKGFVPSNRCIRQLIKICKDADPDEISDSLSS